LFRRAQAFLAEAWNQVAPGRHMVRLDSLDPQAGSSFQQDAALVARFVLADQQPFMQGG
jgi:hypothetical protein